MKLCYRGVPYTYEPPEVKAIDTGISGKYRGAAYPIQMLMTESTDQPVFNLKYRGVAYQTGQLASDAKPAVANIPAIAVTILTEQIVTLDDYYYSTETHS
jgi:hypothetical protein